MNRRRTIKEYTMLLEGNPEVIFPLLCPARESEWIETWRCTMIYSDSGFAEQDCVFRTDFPQDGPRDTWVLSRHERPKLVEFVRINGIRAIRYTITLRQTAQGKTEAEWRQVITGINDVGDRFVEGLSDAEFGRRMERLQQMLNGYLTTGRMLRISDIP